MNNTLIVLEKLSNEVRVHIESMSKQDDGSFGFYLGLANLKSLSESIDQLIEDEKETPER